MLAAIAAGVAVWLAIRAARSGADPRRLRWPLAVTAVVVAARIVVTALLSAGGWVLVDDRVTIGLPAAVVPLTVAAVAAVRGRAVTISGQVAAAGVLISAWLAWVPRDPSGAPAVAAVVAVALTLTAAAAALRRRGHGTGKRSPAVVGALLIVAAVGLLFLPGRPVDSADWGGGPRTTRVPYAADIAQLTGPRGRSADVRFTLTAARGTVRLASGRVVPALTFNGTSPGPTLRVRTGQVVEVVLVNTDVAEGVTIHWHGVDVPNAEDGVPGLTQDAVPPGGQHVYRFVPNRSGTFWYHSHRDSRDTVARGLFGALLVDAPEHDDGEFTLFTHAWPLGKDTVSALNDADAPTRRAVPDGRALRLRLINSSQDPQRIQVTGVQFQVAAIDGNAVHEPGVLPSGTVLLLAAGGRYDVALVMPATTVTVSLHSNEQAATAALVLSPTGLGEPAGDGHGPAFDPAAYGSPDATPPPAAADRRFDLRLDNGFKVSGAGLTFANTVNGRLAPAIPTLMVAVGDTVRMRVTNRGIIDHPMHLHGHRVRVLARNGRPVTGSPWWTDTLNVAPGEWYDITFRADNPGVWMDHCHNFKHAAEGMTWHLAYIGVTAPHDHSGEAAE
ncbi:multicopper oxidase family protein [Dactylosporangium vinaceum]